jgi:hypothetical protein
VKRHPDCENGNCQLTEHKGYPSCEYTSGICEWLEETERLDRDEEHNRIEWERNLTPKQAQAWQRARDANVD